MSKISIIIPSWNTKELLKQCLQSLKSDFEIIVVDNASTDGSPEMVKKEFPKVKLVCNKENVGFAGANNQGAKLASGDLLLLLNSDTVIIDDTVKTLAHFINETENTAVCPLILNEDRSVQKDPCYLRFPSPATALFYYNKILRQISVKIFPSILFSTTNFEKPTEIDQLPGAALMIRKEVFEKIGGLDERFPLYFEDTDLSFRLKKKGYKLMVVPEVKIIHFGRKSIDPIIKKGGMEKFYYLNFNSLFLFCEKNYSETKTVLIKLIIFLHLFSTLKFGLIKKLMAR